MASPFGSSGTGPDAQFESQLASFMQRRLRRVAGYLGLAALVLLVVSRVLDVVNHGWRGAEFTHPAVLVHAAAIVIAFVTWRSLRGRQLSYAQLRFVDALICELVIALCLLVFWFSYPFGVRQQPAILGLLLVTRAVVVPSPALRTFVLSVPAAVGVLAIQLVEGVSYTYDGQLFPQEGFASHVAWIQAILWLSIAIATVTSHVTFGLRRKALEAGRVDRYTLVDRIGTGSMGEVWLARHALMRRPAALKVIRPEIAGEGSFARFEKEVDLTTRLTHPNTVSIFDYGHTPEGLFYYAMEYLDGADLERIVAETGPLEPARVVHVLTQVLASLAEAHAEGLVHRDVKPANIMLCRLGGEADVVKVMDFGLAHEAADTAEGEGIGGTPATMAPEVIRGSDVGAPADVYAIGIVGCFLLTGKQAFVGSTPGDFLRSHLHDEPARPSEQGAEVPAALEDLLLACLAKDPNDRPTAAVLRQKLLALAEAGRWGSEQARSWWRGHAARFARDHAGDGAS